MKILGVSLGTIVLIVLVAVVVRKWGSDIPGLNSIS